MNKSELEEMVKLFHIVGRLKKQTRYDSGEDELNESVADHSYRLIFMTSMFADALDIPVDKDKSIKMAMIQGLGDYLEGNDDERDIAEGKVVAKTGKAQRAFDTIRQEVPSVGHGIYALWVEYQKGESMEARYVKALGKLETMMHIYEAGHQVYNRPEMIPNYADGAVSKFPSLMDALNMLKGLVKQEFEKGEIPWDKSYDEMKTD